MNTNFKITGPGLYKRRDDSTANLVADTFGGVWKDTYTNYLYYEDGYYGTAPDESPNDIVAKLDSAGNILIVDQQPAIEHVPDRLAIATKLLAGMLAYSGDARLDHILHADDLVNTAVKLADKLIARVQETKK